MCASRVQESVRVIDRVGTRKTIQVSEIHFFQPQFFFFTIDETLHTNCLILVHNNVFRVNKVFLGGMNKVV
jgi:hypothetical protein